MPAPPAAAGAAAAAGLAAPGLAFSTSDLTTRPRGPVPAMADKSRPFWPAIRLARGEAKMRAPSVLGVAAAGVAAGVALGDSASAFTAALMSFMAPAMSVLDGAAGASP